MMAVSNISGNGRSGIAPEVKPPPKPEPLDRVKQAVTPQPKTSALASGNTARLRVDPRTDRIIAEIVNEKNEVIKQLPPQELLELAETSRAIQGILFDRST